MTAASIMSFPSYVSPAGPVTMLNVSSLLNQKDSRWLQLEVCREFQRQKCSRPDGECKFAHPPPNVEVQNGRVTACYDSIKARCNREKPACKYFHPPQHLKDQLLINGRNHLALKNALAQQMQQQILPSQMPAMFGTHFVGAGMPLTYSPYLPGGLMSPLLDGGGVVSHAPPAQVPAQTPPTQQIAKRTETLPNGSLLPYKRQAAADKSGLPVFQPIQQQHQQQQHQQQQQQHQQQQYHQLLQLQPNLVPVTCEYLINGSGQQIAIPRFQQQ